MYEDYYGKRTKLWRCTRYAEIKADMNFVCAYLFVTGIIYFIIF